MSGITLKLLMDTDVSGVEQAAQAWLGLAEQIDDTAEGLIRGTRPLEDAWPDGTAGAAAVDRAAKLRAEVSNAEPPCRRIGKQLQQFADGIQDLQELYLVVQGSAAQQGITIDLATGTVTASPGTVASAGRPDMVTSLVNDYVTQLQDILGRAAELDASTANLISVNLPDTSTGFGTGSMSPVSEQTLRDQAGRTPAEVAAWWSALTPQQQEDAIQDYPELVGWLNGVPATDRDTANRLRLDNDQEALTVRKNAVDARILELAMGGATNGVAPSADTQELADLLKRSEELETQLSGLQKVEDKLGSLAADGDKAFLLGIDPTGDGKAIVAIGNPDTARHTAVWVPGLNTELTDSPSNINRVRALQNVADSRTLAEDDVAGIFWLGYDTPELSSDTEYNTSVANGDRSKQGAVALDSFVDSLHATHDAGPSHVTVEGHSYGSTVVGEAAQTGDGLAADDIMTAGSPGMRTDRAENLNIDPRHVWAGEAKGDWVSGGPASWLGHGNEPGDEDFGANRYVVDTEGHSAYWSYNADDTPTTSLLNQAKIIIGEYDSVSLEHGRAPAS
ncbi:alpha/beta hydrolase [Actinoplanes sp. NPDC051494]|uniref:alpha/beta hydrolase n=1 Tax=Actinoplanes sp. NPDC051494 TaxID=3363907 RepID=UPI0037A063BA